MISDPISVARARTLIVCTAITAVIALCAAVVVARGSTVTPLEWMVFAFAAIVALVQLPLQLRARQRGDLRALERSAVLLVALGSMLLLQRIGFGLWGPIMQEPGSSLFRPAFAFMPFVYVAAVAAMPARPGLRLCWAVWAVTLLISLPALVRLGGIDGAYEGAPALLVWLLAANPLFILMLHAMPHYEDELARMRERTELLDRLAESEHRFDLIVAGLQVGIWDRWIGEHDRKWFSPRFEQLLGYKMGELTQSEVGLTRMMHPNERDAVLAETQRQIDERDEFDMDMRLRMKNGKYRWFNARARAERDAAGRLVRLAGSIADIHDRYLAQQALRETQSDLERMAYRDSLTDVYNRRYFDEHFPRECQRARRVHRPLSLLLLDLDHFKAYNDHYGHAAGDDVLRDLAALLQQCLQRPADTLSRLGGEEFGIVLPETDMPGSLLVARRICDALRAAQIPHAASDAGVLTASIGITTLDADTLADAALMYEEADQAMYRVKQSGRDGISHYRNGEEIKGVVKGEEREE